MVLALPRGALGRAAAVTLGGSAGRSRAMGEGEFEGSPSQGFGAAADLESSLAACGHAGRLADVLAAVGLSVATALEGRSPALAGSFVVVGEDVVAVYLSSERMFGVCQFSSSGAMLQVTLPLERVRRVACLEDGIGVRVTVEIDADRSTATSTLLPDGSSSSVQVPAGYELVASAPDERMALRAFHVALTRVL